MSAIELLTPTELVTRVLRYRKLIGSYYPTRGFIQDKKVRSHYTLYTTLMTFLFQGDDFYCIVLYLVCVTAYLSYSESVGA